MKIRFHRSMMKIFFGNKYIVFEQNMIRTCFFLVNKWIFDFFFWKFRKIFFWRRFLWKRRSSTYGKEQRRGQQCSMSLLLLIIMESRSGAPRCDKNGRGRTRCCIFIPSPPTTSRHWAVSSVKGYLDVSLRQNATRIDALPLIISTWHAATIIRLRSAFHHSNLHSFIYDF